MRHVEQTRTGGATSAAGPAQAGPSEHLQRLLRDDEELVWSSKPHRKAHYWTTFAVALVTAGFAGQFLGGLLDALLAAAAIFSGARWLHEIGFLVDLLVFVAVVASAHVAARWRYRLAEFGLTDDRAVATSGIVGRDTSTVSLKDVRDIDTNVGIVDKIFGTGTLKLQVAGGGSSGLSYRYVENPYEVMDILEDARSDAAGAGATG